MDFTIDEVLDIGFGFCISGDSSVESGGEMNPYFIQQISRKNKLTEKSHEKPSKERGNLSFQSPPPPDCQFPTLQIPQLSKKGKERTQTKRKRNGEGLI
jgi:hypothetical protein